MCRYVGASLVPPLFSFCRRFLPLYHHQYTLIVPPSSCPRLVFQQLYSKSYRKIFEAVSCSFSRFCMTHLPRTRSRTRSRMQSLFPHVQSLSASCTTLDSLLSPSVVLIIIAVNCHHTFFSHAKVFNLVFATFFSVNPNASATAL